MLAIAASRTRAGPGGPQISDASSLASVIAFEDATIGWFVDASEIPRTSPELKQSSTNGTLTRERRN